MSNTLELVQNIVTLLNEKGIKTVLFGGWAKELLKVISPRPHNDIDLLYFADNFDKVDQFIHFSENVEEIKLKKFHHKRAFLYFGIMVELILVQNNNNDSFVTPFWNEYFLEWEYVTLVSVAIPPLGCISVINYKAIECYEKQEESIKRIRNKMIAAA